MPSTRELVSAAVLVLCSSSACSGRYRVGEVDDPVLGSGASGMPSRTGAGGTATGSRGATKGSGGTGNAGTGENVAAAGGMSALGPNTECDLPTGDPSELAPPFASPDVVWKRLSLWLNSGVTDPPESLPAKAGYDWAGDLAVQAFQQSQTYGTGAPAVHHYLATAFDLEPGSKVASDWATRLPMSSAPLQLLLADEWSPHRVGLLGEPEWLTRHPRAVSRGVNILRAVFNRVVPPPPPSVVTKIPDDPNLSDRERLEQHRTSPACAACHTIIDPMGLSLEHFDQQGNYRELDAGKPVDSSGSWSSYDMVEFMFQSMEDLGPQLAQSCEANIAFADLNFKTALSDAGLLLEGEDISLAHQADMARVRQAFMHHKDYPSLIRAIAQTDAFLR